MIDFIITRKQEVQNKGLNLKRFKKAFIQIPKPHERGFGSVGKGCVLWQHHLSSSFCFAFIRCAFRFDMKRRYQLISKMLPV